MNEKTALASLPQPLRWVIVFIPAAIAGWLLYSIGFPGGQFIGPMIVAIILALLGISLKLPRIWFNLGQGAIGILIASAISFTVLATIGHEWPSMIAITAITLLMSIPVGILNVRYGGMPGSTAAWGTTPGAASVMVAMAEDTDGDPRVVAAMQYVRVICVVLTGAIVSHYFAASQGGSAHVQPHHAINYAHLAITLVLLVAGSLIGRRLMPAGAMLGPVILATPLHLAGWITLEIPAPLLTIAYGAIGCYVGLRFDRKTVLYVLKSIPWMIFSSLLLILLCALSAALMSIPMQTDYLSLYLATSPGGLDTMTIIALDTHANVGLVAALQILRLFAVVFSGPTMARFIARFAREST